MKAGDHRGRWLDDVAAGKDAGLGRLVDQLVGMIAITIATFVFRHDECAIKVSV